MPPQPLSDRAKNRLRLAAGLLRGHSKGNSKPASPLPVSRETFYEDMLAYIAALPLAARDALKESVDWLERYDEEDKRQGPISTPPTAGPRA